MTFSKEKCYGDICSYFLTTVDLKNEKLYFGIDIVPVQVETAEACCYVKKSFFHSGNGRVSLELNKPLQVTIAKALLPNLTKCVVFLLFFTFESNYKATSWGVEKMWPFLLQKVGNELTR